MHQTGLQVSVQVGVQVRVQVRARVRVRVMSRVRYVRFSRTMARGTVWASVRACAGRRSDTAVR